MKPVLILKLGSTEACVAERRGDFEDWFRTGLSLESEQVRVVDPRRGQPFPCAAELAAVVITGSSSNVTEAHAWSQQAAAWLRPLVESRALPILGICYGHQILAEAMGGSVDWNPRGREIGTITVELEAAAADDPLLTGLPTRIQVQATHSQSVLELPPHAVLLARNDHDPHQAFRLGTCVWGLQFHPEFDADIVQGYLDARRSTLIEEGLDPDRIASGLKDHAFGGRILQAFRRQLLTTASAASGA